jgi:amylosucrase
MLLENQLEKEAQKSLLRLMPRVSQTLKQQILQDPPGWQKFTTRLEGQFPRLFALYYNIYQNRYDFIYFLEELVTIMARSWFERSPDLRALDDQREIDPLWFQSNRMLGGVCYVDRFAGTLEGVQARIPYFKEVGLTYLHLMPLFKAPKGENDGGYAVSSYREIQPPLGSMQELASLAQVLRQEGISLVLDFVFNHTSDEHVWARTAKLGDELYQDFYHIFPDREMPARYERTLREIFPEEHGGAFTFLPDLLQEGGWVWTTFHSYQWDLNYSNPTVFNHMVQEMLFLANQGVEVLRLDAVAFIWKQMDTSCENLMEAHTLIQAFNAVARIAAPALLFKSEAIVHPDEVAKYIAPEECQLSYNPLLMALLWNSLATRKVRMLSQAMSERFQLPSGTAWVNYVRVHDDIGWTFSDEDATLLGVNGYDHRRFLNEFYRGRFEGSFARGLPFQENALTGDCRISGTCASLAGLEKALSEEGANEVELAIRRIHLIYGIIFTIGGIPLIYLGDEIGMLNDYSFLDDALHSRDSRWVHRPKADDDQYAKRSDKKTIQGRVYLGLKTLIALRKKHSVFADGETEIFWTENEHVFGFVRSHNDQRAVILANFSEDAQIVPARIFKPYAMQGKKRLHGKSKIHFSGDETIAPLDLVVLA